MNTKAKDQPRRKYDDEFKRQALQMIANGQAVRSVAQSLGIGENLLHKWKQATRASASPDEREVSELRARLRQVEMERDILKKALSIFSRQTLVVATLLSRRPPLSIRSAPFVMRSKFRAAGTTLGTLVRRERPRAPRRSWQRKSRQCFGDMRAAMVHAASRLNSMRQAQGSDGDGCDV